MEVVRLDELVEVDAQELHRNAEMSAEVEVLRHLDDMVLLLLVLCILLLSISNVNLLASGDRHPSSRSS